MCRSNYLTLRSKSTPIHIRLISLFYYIVAKALKCCSRSNRKLTAEPITESRFCYCPKSCGFRISQAGSSPLLQQRFSNGGLQLLPTAAHVVVGVTDSVGRPCATEEDSKEANTR